MTAMIYGRDILSVVSTIKDCDDLPTEAVTYYLSSALSRTACNDLPTEAVTYYLSSALPRTSCNDIPAEAVTHYLSSEHYQGHHAMTSRQRQ